MSKVKVPIIYLFIVTYNAHLQLKTLKSFSQEISLLVLVCLHICMQHYILDDVGCN